MTTVSLLSDGELLIVAAAISAAGVVDLFDRKHRAGEMSVGQRVAMVSALLIAIFAASAYQGIKSDNYQESDQAVTSDTRAKHRQLVAAQRNANASILLFSAALCSGLCCAVLSATPGSSEV